MSGLVGVEPVEQMTALWAILNSVSAFCPAHPVANSGAETGLGELGFDCI